MVNRLLVFLGASLCLAHLAGCIVGENGGFDELFLFHATDGTES